VKKYLPIESVSARYGDRSYRTLDRWVETGKLPPPVYIAGHRYWIEEELDRHDEARPRDGNPAGRARTLQSQDNWQPLHDAANRATKHIFQNRAHRVDAPSPQAASQRRRGITTTQEDND
jgi:predicted site-specific integrase-resolvase